eukprot:Em0015g879a
MGAGQFSIIFLSLCGIAISFYAIHVKRAKKLDTTYTALCDLDETFSCSVVLTSPFSDGFGVVPAVLGDDNPFNYSNASVGVIFYLVLLALSLSHSPKLLLAACLLSLCSCGFSVYLIYVLVVVLRKVCLVCYATHVINLLLLGLLASRWRVSIREGNKRKAA